MTTRPGVEDYYAALVRLIANQMVDPHRYFEQKLIGQMQDERDAVAQNARLSQVLQWLDDGLLTPAQRERVDAQLLAHEPAHLEAVQARQHQVEDDHVVVVLGRDFEGGGAVGGVRYRR